MTGGAAWQLSAAAVVAARGAFGERRRALADEDGFTLSVRAGELLEGAVGYSGVRKVEVAAGLSAEGATGLPLAIGLPRAELGLVGPERSLTEILSDPGPAEGNRLLLLADDLRPGPAGLPPPSRDAGAVALLLSRSPSRDPGTLPSAIPPGSRFELGEADSPLAEAAALADAVPRRVDDASPVPLGEGPDAGGDSVVLSRVSEGAYVPWPRYVESLPSRWRFAAEQCGSCRALTFPKRGSCRECGSASALTEVELPRSDLEVEAVTTVHAGAQPTEFDWRVERLGAYDVALVDLAPGIRATLQVSEVAPGTLRAGSRVATRLRRLYPMEGLWRYGRKAVPSPLP